MPETVKRQGSEGMRAVPGLVGFASLFFFNTVKLDALKPVQGFVRKE